jgi:hypothetical protein
VAEEIRDDEFFRRQANLVYFLFPNAVLNFPTSGHAELWNIWPAGVVGQARVTARFYIPNPPRSERQANFWQRNFELTRDVVFNEDFTLQAGTYAGMRNGASPDLVYGRNEPALIHFHTMLRDALGA